MRIRFRLFWPVLAAVFLAAFLLYRQKTPLPPAVPRPPLPQEVILQGIRPLEIVPVEYPRELDFGKGKFALFDFSVPSDSDFRLEKLVVSLDGANDAEMPEAWLRFNGVRVYTTAPVQNGEAVFTAFPPAETGTWNSTQGTAEADIAARFPELADVPKEMLGNIQEKQFLLRPARPLPLVLPAGSIVSIGIYGKWTDTIAPRPIASGLRFCLKEVSGTMAQGDEPAKTSFAQPICWPRFGIR